MQLRNNPRVGVITCLAKPCLKCRKQGLQDLISPNVGCHHWFLCLGPVVSFLTGYRNGLAVSSSPGTSKVALRWPSRGLC